MDEQVLIYDALRNLVPLLQAKKREKHPWRSVNFSKVAGFSIAPENLKNCSKPLLKNVKL